MLSAMEPWTVTAGSGGLPTQPFHFTNETLPWRSSDPPQASLSSTVPTLVLGFLFMQPISLDTAILMVCQLGNASQSGLFIYFFTFPFYIIPGKDF